VSSPFGWRIHPVLGVRRFHRGIDYAAAPGTPVRAAADGVIDDIGRRGNYGRYIRVSHDDHVATAYAHLEGSAPRLKVGSPVRRGQIIGYVGASGLATGPHLYYEVLVDHRQVNPARTPLVTPIALDDTELPAFQDFVRQTDLELAD
jgi:murein DD-endopeptidase MepM/ murein hydrolase activator NlpD